jgi:hypothetical protein
LFSGNQVWYFSSMNSRVAGELYEFVLLGVGRLSVADIYCR